MPVGGSDTIPYMPRAKSASVKRVAGRNLFVSLSHGSGVAISPTEKKRTLTYHTTARVPFSVLQSWCQQEPRNRRTVRRHWQYRHPRRPLHLLMEPQCISFQANALKFSTKAIALPLSPLSSARATPARTTPVPTSVSSASTTRRVRSS